MSSKLPINNRILDKTIKAGANQIVANNYVKTQYTWFDHSYLQNLAKAL
jgi:hypothetical protein